MRYESGTTYIDGHECRKHSDYKGFELYRCFDGGQPRMRYFALGVIDCGFVSIEAKNLDGIKRAVTEMKE